MFPRIAHAALDDTVAEFMARVYDVVLNPLIGFMFALALVLFLIGMIQFFVNRGSSNEKANEGKQHMLWGVIGMFIMLSVFGIMRLIIGTIGSDIQI
jgi:ABC-type multidrug transport system fused ATPase/permease subunit